MKSNIFQKGDLCTNTFQNSYTMNRRHFTRVIVFYVVTIAVLWLAVFYNGFIEFHVIPFRWCHKRKIFLSIYIRGLFNYYKVMILEMSSTEKIEIPLIPDSNAIPLIFRSKSYLIRKLFLEHQNKSEDLSHNIFSCLYCCFLIRVQ